MGGSSKEQTVGYFYEKDLQGILCHSPVDAITRIECDDREIARDEIKNTGNYYINKPDIFGGPDREGGVQGNIDVLFGKDDQLQNSYMRDKIGEYIPSFRGVLSIVFKKLYVGMNPYLRSFKFRVKKTSVGWYDEKREIPPPPRADSPEYNFDKLNWEMTGADGAHGSSNIPVGNFGTSSFIVQSSNKPVGEVFNLKLDISASTEYRRVIGGETVSGYDWIKKGGAYENSGFNKYMIEVSNPPSVYYLNNGTSSDPYVDDDRFATISIPVANGAIVTCICDPSDGRMAKGTTNGYYQYMNFVGASVVDKDINPAHIIYDLLSNKIYGKGAPDSKIDLVALKKMADTLYDERMGISIVWGESSSYEDFMNLVCDHIKAVVPYVDVQTGKWTTKLLRDDYSKPALIHINESNIESVKNFTRKTMADAVNIVTVTYWDREQGKTATISVDNPARVAQQGKPITQKIDYDGFTNSEIAGRVAMRELKTLSSFLASVTLQAFGEEAMSLKVGDCFRWSWGDFRISEAVMRVTKVNYGGVLTTYATIDAIEDSFSTPNEAVVPYLPPNEQDSEAPKQADFMAIEAPYFDIVQMFGEAEVNNTLETNPDVGYVLVSADRPQTNALNATLLTSLSNDFEDVGAVDFCPSAKLIEDIDKISQSFLIKDIENLSDARTNTLIQVNDEVMAYVSYDLTTRTLNVKRGVHDTVPQVHNADSIIYFWDQYASYDQTQRIDGSTVNVKVLTNTGRDILSEDSAISKQVELNSRAIRPYPPANVKINGQYFPIDFVGDLVVTWVDRNRIQQTGGEILGFYDNGVTIESDVNYIIELYDSNDVLIDSQNVGQLNTATLNTSSLSTQKAKISLYSIKNGFESFQKFDHELISIFLPPYNLQGAWNNTTQSIDLTWEFDE